jgi:Mg2+ and Co2+ transporter CorA
MKGTIFDLLKLAAEKPEVAKELAELAAKHGIEFSDEVSDDELAKVAGGMDGISTAGEDMQMWQFDVQQNQQELTRMMTMYSNTLKSWHEASKSIINNLKQ